MSNVTIDIESCVGHVIAFCDNCAYRLVLRNNSTVEDAEQALNQLYYAHTPCKRLAATIKGELP